jgi:hypothetical protein
MFSTLHDLTYAIWQICIAILNTLLRYEWYEIGQIGQIGQRILSS